MLRRVARGVDISSEQKNSFKGRREQDFGRFIYKEISGCKHEWAKCINIKSFKCRIIVFFSLWWLKWWYCMYSRFVVSDSLQPVDWPARLFCPWDFSGKNTGVGCDFLLQGIFLTQGSNIYLLLGRWILYLWVPLESWWWY